MPLPPDLLANVLKLPRPSFRMTFERTLIFLLLLVALYKLDGIEHAITDSSKALAVALNRIVDHDRRLENLETLFLDRSKQ